MLASNPDGSAVRGPNWKEARDESIGPCKVFKFTYSTLLVIFSIAVAISLILDGETKVSQNASPAFAIALICLAIGWLFMVEGGQVSDLGTNKFVPMYSTLNCS